MTTIKLFKLIASSLFLVASALGFAAWYFVSQYRLPFSILPIITAFLGPIDFFATYSSALGISSSRRASKRPLPPLLLFLNLLLLILPAVLIALGAPYLGDSQCQLDQTWHTWYSAHNAKAIKGVQDALQCCGFRSAKDMPFPFPFKPKKGDNRPPVLEDACMNLMEGVDRPCAPLWQGELKTAAGLVVGSGALMVVLKFIFLMIVLGNPKVTEKWFVRSKYSEYDNSRTIEEVVDDDDDDVAEEEQERPAPHIATVNVEGTPNETGANERTRLLLPKDHGSNGNQIIMHDENAWRS